MYKEYLLFLIWVAPTIGTVLVLVGVSRPTAIVCLFVA